MCYNRKSNLQHSEWVTVKGTSKLEEYHPHLARALPRTGYSPDAADGIFALFNMQWNLKRSVDNKGDPGTATVEPWLQNNLAQLSRALQLPSDTFQTVNIPASTEGLFGVEYVPDALDEEAAQEAEQQGRAEVEADLEEEDEALLAAAALDAMRLLGRPDCNLPNGPLHLHIATAHVTSIIINCLCADGSSPAASSGRLRDSMQPPAQEAEALARPSAPAQDAPSQRARRRLPASLQQGSTRPPSELSAPGDLQAVLMESNAFWVGCKAGQ